MSTQETLTVEAGSCRLVHQNLQKMTEILGNYSSVLKNVEVLLQQINSKMETSDEKIDFNKQSPVMSLSTQTTSSPDTKQSSKQYLQPNEGKAVAKVDSESDAFEIFQRQLQSDSDPCSEDDQSDGSSQEPTATSTPKKSSKSDDNNKVTFESDEAVTVPLTDDVPVPSHVNPNRKNDLQCSLKIFETFSPFQKFTASTARRHSSVVLESSRNISRAPPADPTNATAESSSRRSQH